MQTVDALQGYRIAGSLREKGIPVIIGGVHASLNPSDVLEHADFVIRNEGEDSFPELIEEMDSPNPDYSGILGLSYHQNGEQGTTRPGRLSLTLIQYHSQILS